MQTCKGRFSHRLRVFCVFIFLAASAFISVEAAAQEVSWTEFQGTDDFQFDPTIPLDSFLGAIHCAPGAQTGNPLQPCPAGSRILVHGLPGSSLISANDPRFNGIGTSTANANLDPQYAGRVWGNWALDLHSGNGRWQGVWHGWRSFVPGGGGNSWITDVRLFGTGSGSVDGLRVTVQETIVTFTPIPVPYEVLLFLGFPGICPGGVCPPEGVLEGRIFELPVAP